MIAKAERLSHLRVADAMTHGVVVINANSTMTEAADLLCHHHITGAPVVDEHGRCIGVLTGTDFIHSKAEELDERSVGYVLTSNHPGGLYCIDQVRHDLVRQHMSPAVQTINDNTSLTTAARCMCDAHIHRLIVVDRQSKPVGVLTSLDLVATLIALVEEQSL